jgi:hypothetical protein
MKEKPLFFARKFDPLFNQQLINVADQSIYGLYSAGKQNCQFDNFMMINSIKFNF